MVPWRGVEKNLMEVEVEGIDKQPSSTGILEGKFKVERVSSRTGTSMVSRLKRDPLAPKH